MTRLLRQLGLILVLLGLSGALYAEDQDVCSEFKDGVVDESLLSVMLSAAQKGQLYRIQPSSSRVGFCVNSPLNNVKGNFSDFRGGITLDPDSNGHTMVLIHANSLKAANPLIRSVLVGKNFFDVDKHPDILFVSHSFRWTGTRSDELKGELKGDLTLRGITRPVTFDVTLQDQGKHEKDGRILVQATTRINREEFGMNKLKSLADSEVRLCIHASAKRYQVVATKQGD